MFIRMKVTARKSRWTTSMRPYETFRTARRKARNVQENLIHRGYQMQDTHDQRLHPEKPRDENSRGKRNIRYKPGQDAHLRRDREGKHSCGMTGASPHYRVIATLNRCRVEELIQAFSPGKTPRKSIEGTVRLFRGPDGNGEGRG